MKLRHFLPILCAATAISGCGPDAEGLSSAELFLDGSGTYSTPTNYYIYADSTGAIDTSGNTIEVAFSDSATPLMLNSYTGVFAASLNTGSCSSIGNLVAAVSNNVVTTSLSATGCTDQATMTIAVDTSQIYDQNGFSGWSLLSFPVTVDNAPKVTTAATGNTAVDGSGTTEGSSGVFKISGGGTDDLSIVVTFSKDLTGGTFNAAISAAAGSTCAATLGTPVLVASSSGKTLAWPLNNLGSVSVGDSCVINVSGVKDVVNNPEDPNDSNIGMTFTFQ